MKFILFTTEGRSIAYLGTVEVYATSVVREKVLRKRRKKVPNNIPTNQGDCVSKWGNAEKNSTHSSATEPHAMQRKYEMLTIHFDVTVVGNQPLKGLNVVVHNDAARVIVHQCH